MTKSTTQKYQQRKHAKDDRKMTRLKHLRFDDDYALYRAHRAYTAYHQAFRLNFPPAVQAQRRQEAIDARAHSADLTARRKRLESELGRRARES
jgi:hypothetical protein